MIFWTMDLWIQLLTFYILYFKLENHACFLQVLNHYMEKYFIFSE